MLLWTNKMKSQQKGCNGGAQRRHVTKAPPKKIQIAFCLEQWLLSLRFLRRTKVKSRTTRLFKSFGQEKMLASVGNRMRIEKFTKFTFLDFYAIFCHTNYRSASIICRDRCRNPGFNHVQATHTSYLIGTLMTLDGRQFRVEVPKSELSHCKLKFRIIKLILLISPSLSCDCYSINHLAGDEALRKEDRVCRNRG